jgi:hypothetical protein
VRGCSGWDETSGRRVEIFGFRQARRLLGQQAQQFDGIEPRRRRRAAGGTKDAQQLRKRRRS